MAQAMPNEPPCVSIIVVSYNTCAMTLEAIRSTYAETTVPFEMIVVDNASPDGSAEAIATAFTPDTHPNLRLMAETANHGFAKANNIAARHARGKYLLLLNPDTVVLDGAVDKLVAFAEDLPRARIWGGRTLFGDRSLNPTNCWRRMSLWGLICQVLGVNSVLRSSELFNPEGYGGWARDRVRAVDIVTGCFFLIERSLWEELGGFDLSYVMYAEEADLCLRARARGADPHVTPNAEIIHYAGAASGRKSRKMVMLLRGKITLIANHFPGWQRPVATALLQLWPLSRMLGAGILARLSGSGALREAAETWAEVWRRRGEWRDGYPVA